MKSGKNAVKSPIAENELLELIDKSVESAGYEAFKAFHSDVSESRGWYNSLKGEGQVPSLIRIMKVFSVIEAKRGNSDIEERKRIIWEWILCWAKAEAVYAKKSPKISPEKMNINTPLLDEWIKASEELKDILSALFPPSKPVNLSLPSANPKSLPTLDQFPEAFSPLVVITGSSQAVPPESVADLFRSSAQFTDVAYLCQLKLAPKTLVIPDRQLILMSEAERISLLRDTHILSLGGPRVNVVTRHLCKTSAFGYEFRPEYSHFLDLFDDLKKTNLLTTRARVQLFCKYLESRSTESPETSKEDEAIHLPIRKKIFELVQDIRRKAKKERGRHEDIKGIFTPTGLIDPIKRQVTEFRDEPDIGLVSLGPNPWDKDENEKNRYRYTSIITSGLHPLGAIHALKALSYPKHFSNRRLGGCCHVAEGIEPHTEYERLMKGKFRWDDNISTPEYKIADIQQTLADQLTISSQDRFTNMGVFVSDATIQQQMDFLERFE